MWDGHLGHTTISKHRITLLNSHTVPVLLGSYQACKTLSKFEKAEIGKMLAEDAIEAAKTEETKRDKTLSFYADFHKCSPSSKRDSYLVLSMDECIDSNGEAIVSSTLDAKGGYWKVETDDTHNDKTAFTSRYNLLRHVRLPFGLRNASTTFQRTMYVLQSSITWRIALVYITILVLFSNTPQQRIDHVSNFLFLLHTAGATLQLKKCKLFTDIIDYLNHVIFPRRLDLSSRTKDAICGLQPPINRTELRSFLGSGNFFR